MVLLWARVVTGAGDPTQFEPAPKVKDAVLRRAVHRAGVCALPLRGRVATVRRMAGPTPDQVREALRAVLFPGFNRDIVRLGMVGDDLQVEHGRVHIHLRPGTEKPELLQQLARSVEAVVGRLPGVTGVELHMARADEGRGRDPFAGRAKRKR